ncbi:MAG: Spy0128 family protein [Eggerthellaceae bacterium]
MHATITTNNDTYEAGTTAIVTFKYTLDQGSVSTGDYVIVTIPSSIASKVRFSLNSQHFSGSEDLGNSQYKLTFGSGIESGISGSFNAYVTAKNVDATTPGTISAGDASKTITIVPSGSPSGTGTYTDTIMKDGFENDGVSYDGYDYSEGYGNNAAQVGVADLTNGGTFKYRLYINDKKGNISNVTVVDRIPDGMTLNMSKSIEVTDQATGKAIDPSNYSIEIDGQTLTFKYPGSTSNTIQVNYWVDIPAGSNTSKYTNTATITYMQNGETHQEHRNYVLQGTDNNASNGEKSVDKSIISTDPDDQFVTYTIKFWNSNGFAAGEINLTDELDSHVSFVSADESDCFSIEQDASDPHKIKISNTKAIDSSTTTYVRFMVDMSNVPVGYTVKNSVGGNTTKTTKYGGSMTLDATKQIDGKSSGLTAGQFSFQLLSSDDTVLQTKTNDADGKISFDRISYNASDVGKTFMYKVKEVSGDDASYTYDPSVYTVTVTPQLETDSDGNPTGNIIATPQHQQGRHRC